MVFLILCCLVVRVEENKRFCIAGAVCDARVVWSWLERFEDLAYWLVSIVFRFLREDVELLFFSFCLSCGLSFFLGVV